MAVNHGAVLTKAFSFLELTPFSTFGDDHPFKQAARDFYPAALDECLAWYDWSFASTLKAVPEATAAVADPDLPFAYAVPADMVQLRAVKPQDVKWRLDGGLIRADAVAPLLIRYTVRLEDIEKAPQRFQTAVAYRLAALMSPRISKSVNRVDVLERKAQDELRAVSFADRTAASPRRDDGLCEQPDWTSAAIGGGRYYGGGLR